MVTTGYGERPGQLPRALDMHKPLGTVVAGGTKHNLVSSFLESVESVIPDAGRARQVAAFMAQHNRGAVGRELQSPLQCIAGNINKSLVTVELEPGEAAPHLGRAGMVAAFLTEYYGNGGQWSDLHKPMNTAVGRARFSLVTVEIDSKTYVMTDVCMRMLAPRELARAQGFEDNYVLTGTKVEQIARLGNSVCPPIAKALVEAQFNLGDYQTAA
jgi:DNA (cytosine-5)-methyltransferase 1